MNLSFPVILSNFQSSSGLFQRMEAFRDAVRRVMSRSSDDQQLDGVLMASVQKQLTEVSDAVASVWPLAALSDPERRECAKTSAVRRFPARSIVYGKYYTTSLPCADCPDYLRTLCLKIC